MVVYLKDGILYDQGIDTGSYNLPHITSFSMNYMYILALDIDGNVWCVTNKEPLRLYKMHMDSIVYIHLNKDIHNTACCVNDMGKLIKVRLSDDQFTEIATFDSKPAPFIVKAKNTYAIDDCGCLYRSNTRLGKISYEKELDAPIVKDIFQSMVIDIDDQVWLIYKGFHKIDVPKIKCVLHTEQYYILCDFDDNWYNLQNKYFNLNLLVCKFSMPHTQNVVHIAISGEKYLARIDDGKVYSYNPMTGTSELLPLLADKLANEQEQRVYNTKSARKI
jgi:hypothetical protein